MTKPLGKFSKVIKFAVEQVRTLTPTNSGSYSVALPVHFVRALGWEGKKVTVKLTMDRDHKWKSIVITALSENGKEGKKE